MSKVIAVFNQKGGVGKTTTNVNLSSCIAVRGKKVLVVDIDPQGNTTSGLGIDKKALERTIYEVLIGNPERNSNSKNGGGGSVLTFKRAAGKGGNRTDRV